MGVRLLVAFLLLCCLSYGVAAANDSCVGQPFGWKYPDRTDCHGYFVCYMDRAYQAYCDYAEKFDDITKKCVPGKCPPCNCDAVPTVEPTPTTTPTPPLTPESTPTVVPTPEPSPDPSTEPPTEPSTEPSTEPTLTPEPTSGPTSEETAAPTPGETPTPEPSPEPSPEPTPEPTPTPTPTPEQTPSVEPSPEPSPNPDPTTGPTPTPESTPSSAPTPGQTPTATPAPVTVPDGHIDPNIKECNNLPNGSFLRNSEHCRTYYVCRSGNAIKHRCAPNQWFDDIHFVCNVRQKVNCPSGKD